jgi:hypothetical protein
MMTNDSISKKRLCLLTLFVKRSTGSGRPEPVFLCTEHVRQLEGESPFDNLMEVKS